MPIFVRDGGKPPTVLFGRMICAMPRNSVSVPIVTASDGSPTRVTSTPFSSPPAAPTTSAASIAGQIDQPWAKSDAITVPESPSIEATERSISPVITISATGSAMIAISPMFRPM